MNTLTLQRGITKEIDKLEKVIKKASRVLLEFEIAQSEWDIAHGRFKVYKSADAYMKNMHRRLKAK